MYAKRERERGVCGLGARESPMEDQGRERWKTRQAAHTLLGEFLEMGPGALRIRAEPGGEELHRGILPPSPPPVCMHMSGEAIAPCSQTISQVAHSRQQAAGSWQQAQDTSRPQQRARTVVVARSSMVCSPVMALLAYSINSRERQLLVFEQGKKASERPEKACGPPRRASRAPKFLHRMRPGA
jgi:hypothetical protein